MKCDICGAELKTQRSLTVHKALRHPDKYAEEKINNLETRNKELEAQLADAQNQQIELESGTDKSAILADWVENLTPDAWMEIGKEKGFMADPGPDPLPAENTEEKHFLAQHGVAIKINKG